MIYPGGKNADGIYHRLINHMPPHELYVEPFAGSAALMRLKRPAPLNIGIDRNPAVIQALTARYGDSRGVCSIAGSGGTAGESTTTGNGDVRSTFVFYHGDALSFLKFYPLGPRSLVYCDPPYMHETRGRGRYPFDFEDSQHAELLRIITSLDCMVMISGYWTSTYASALKDWHHISYPAMTRAGRTATEWLWSNFAPPLALHDYSYLGADYRQRERIKKKKARWVARLQQMQPSERHALLAAIQEAWRSLPPPEMARTAD
jgi:DNA adenine methylase